LLTVSFKTTSHAKKDDAAIQQEKKADWNELLNRYKGNDPLLTIVSIPDPNFVPMDGPDILQLGEALLTNTNVTKAKILEIVDLMYDCNTKGL